MSDRLTFTFHGVRGSVAIDRADSARYGGSTICISARLSDDHYLVLDAGTGLRNLQHQLPGGGGLTFTFLLTHFHWDHLLGLPFFRVLYQPESMLNFYATAPEGGTVESGIAGIMEPPLFPVPLRLAASQRTFVDVPDGPWRVGPLTVMAARLNHPQGVNAYRIDHGDRSLVLATDVEAGESDSDEKLVALAEGVDVLIHDAQYLPDEIENYRGWGHSTWEQAVDIAERAGVERLVVISHDPERTDDGVDEIVAAARARFPNVVAAYTGMQLEL
jgi:phosphoribosyl 1,2-cyclic phosphodiesterase